MTSFDSWDNELYHYGIKGQKWGIRRYQNEDGSLTAEGEARYGANGTATGKERAKFLNRLDQQRAHAVARQQELMRSRRLSAPYKRQQYEETISKTDRTIANVLDNAKKAGYTMQSKPVKRFTMTGQDAFKSILATASTTTMVNALSYMSAANRAYAMAAKNSLGIGTATANLYAVPAIISKRVKGTKYKADERYKNA